jgi:hypothetical protein
VSTSKQIFISLITLNQLERRLTAACGINFYFNTVSNLDATGINELSFNWALLSIIYVDMPEDSATSLTFKVSISLLCFRLRAFDQTTDGLQQQTQHDRSWTELHRSTTVCDEI